MTCFFPLAGYYSKDLNPTGKRSIVFDKRKSWSGIKLPIPCGQCMGCRLTRARVWAIRCVHEKRMHKASAFLTLTYNDEFLPAGGTLVKRDLQLFMKRLRKVRPAGLRFFACGEYGDRTQRPHYHVLLLNNDFIDLKVGPKSKSGQDQFRSFELDNLWGMGDCLVGQVSMKSCAYVARYCLKKVTGPAAASYYMGREPEFVVMSRRPGLGAEWYEKFKSDAYRHDSVIIEDYEMPVPKFYDTKFEAEDAKRLAILKAQRKAKALLHREDNSYARRVVKDRFEELKAKFFVRDV